MPEPVQSDEVRIPMLHLGLPAAAAVAAMIFLVLHAWGVHAGRRPSLMTSGAGLLIFTIAAVSLAHAYGERASQERALGEARFRFLFEHAPIAYHEIDSQGIVLRVNRAECRLLGLEASELLGRPIWQLMAPEQREFSRLSIARKIASQRTDEPFLREYLHRNGTKITVEIHEKLIRDRSGHTTGLLSALLDVTGQRRAKEALQRNNEELAQALVAARDAAELKSRFLANMSHEIRTPMNGVLGMTELLLTTELDGEQRDYAESVKNSAEALLSVINDILDFSKIEAGKLELEQVPFDLRRVVEEVTELLSLRARAKGLDMTSIVLPEVPHLVRGDPGRLRQILTNLLGNAVKFTEEGQVGVHVEPFQETGDRILIRFEVRDTGIGIAPGRHARLFESFVQGDSSTTRKYGGTGLGLSISRQLAGMMGGEIGAESELGRGSTFWFTAAFERCAGAESGPCEDVDVFRGLRVLVVDDHAINRSVLRQYLEPWGGRAAIAALQRARREEAPFHLALLDLNMPECDGFTAGGLIKSDPHLQETLLFCLTSSPMKGDGARLRQIGFAGYLHKPIRQSVLYHALAEVLARRADPVNASIQRSLVTRHVVAERARARLPLTSGATMLVVEDNEVNRKIAQRVLEKSGYLVHMVENGRQAVEAVASIHYDVVLMDVQMPELDGLAATAEIRSLPPPAGKTPVVAMTANAMTGDRERCLAAGMDDYVSKPIRMEDLERVMKKWADSNPKAES